MDRGDLQRLTKEELIDLVLRMQRPEKTSRTSSKPPSTDRKERRDISWATAALMETVLAVGKKHWIIYGSGSLLIVLAVVIGMVGVAAIPRFWGILVVVPALSGLFGIILVLRG